MQIAIPENEYDAYRPRVEDVEFMRKSLFYEVYAKAEKQVDSIISVLPQKEDKRDSDSENKDRGIENRVRGLENKVRALENKDRGLENKDRSLENSNIIAFTGGRGTGKTSVMLSYMQMLESDERLDEADKEKHCYFHCLPMIDPSHISKDETIIDVILSKMYTKFELLVKREECRVREKFSIDDQRELYQGFEDVYKAVRSLCKDRNGRYSEMEYLEGLRHTAAGVDLHDKLDSLIYKYLSIFCEPSSCGNKPSAFLVISVDDLDLNISKGFSICEDLRKYLNFPNVIILFSVNMDQLSDIVKQEYISAFKTARSETDLELIESIPNMASKYLEKLIPYERRCALPEMAVTDPSSISVVLPEKMAVDLPKNKNHEYLLIDCVLQLLYLKAGLILVKDEHEGHAFIPRNLRGVVQLLYTLTAMQSVKLLDNQKNNTVGLALLTSESSNWKNTEPILRRNLDTLTQLIVQSYALQLPSCSAKILRTLSQERWEHLNQTLVREMFSVVRSKETVEMKEQTIILNFAAPQIHYENVTIGDVLYLLRYYNKSVHYDDGYADYFTALFNTLYSIRSMQVFFLSVSENDSFPERKRRLHRLLGGLIFNPLGNRGLVRNNYWRDADLDFLSSCVPPEGVAKEKIIDELLLGTVCTKRIRGTQFGTKEQFHLEEDAYYESISREFLEGELGNTTKYFSYCYPRCFTSVLYFDQSEIKDDDYIEWYENYISPLPLLSTDCIYYYLTNAPKAINTARPSAQENALRKDARVIIGSKKLINDLISKITTPENLNTWLTDSLNAFPFIKVSSTLQTFLYSPTESSILPYQTDNNQKKKSLLAIKSKLASAFNKFKKYGTDDYNAFETSRGVNTVGNALQDDDREYLQGINWQIIQERNNFKSLSNKTPEEFEASKAKILNILQRELDQVNQHLSAYESPAEKD